MFINIGAKHSTILDSVVAENKLSAFTLNDEVLCHLKLVCLYDSNITLDHTFRDGKIKFTTPRTSLSSSLKDMYKNIGLADNDDCISMGIVLGTDIYHRLLLPETIIKTGQTDPTNATFGYVISGAFFN